MKRRNGERGAALIVVLFASALILLLLLTALTVTRTSGVIMARQLSSQGQATSAASAGLIETLSWFVRPPPQPLPPFPPHHPGPSTHARDDICARQLHGRSFGLASISHTQRNTG